MENLGDIDRQSLAGALTTGTHGSGTGFGILATQVEALSLLDGHGNLHSCSRTQAPELFRAALVSMGLLGVITELKLRLEPAYRLHYTHLKGDLDETLENLEDYKRNNRNFEFSGSHTPNQSSKSWSTAQIIHPATMAQCAG